MPTCRLPKRSSCKQRTAAHPKTGSRRTRGWSADEWSAAAASLMSARGLVDDEMRVTAAGAELRQAIESGTDRLAAPIVAAIGRDGADELVALLRPLAERSHGRWRRPRPQQHGRPLAAARNGVTQTNDVPEDRCRRRPLAHLPADRPRRVGPADGRAATIRSSSVRWNASRSRTPTEASLELAARLLAAGIGKGSRVGLLYANTPAWVVAWLAAARLGALTVPLSTFAPGPELRTDRTRCRRARRSPLLAFRDDRPRRTVEDGLPGLAASGPATRSARTCRSCAGSTSRAAGRHGRHGSRQRCPTTSRPRRAGRGPSLRRSGTDQHLGNDRRAEDGCPHPWLPGSPRRAARRAAGSPRAIGSTHRCRSSGSEG